jgi:CHAD domain-containing protein
VPAIDELRAVLERQRNELERSEPGVREGADPEELHRFRVAARRSRAMIRASRPLVRDQLAALDRELRWLGSATGPVRDLDVLIERLRKLRPSLEPDQAGVESIVAALELERLESRDALVTLLDTVRYRELLGRFAETLQALHVADHHVSLEQLARKELDRLRGSYDDLGKNPSDEDLHALRIRAKHARYSADLASTAGGERFTDLASALSEVQDVIGAHQDAVVAEQRVRALAREEARLAAGRIVERERTRRKKARAALPAAMKAVERRASAADL